MNTNSSENYPDQLAQESFDHIQSLIGDRLLGAGRTDIEELIRAACREEISGESVTGRVFVHSEASQRLLKALKDESIDEFVMVVGKILKSLRLAVHTWRGDGDAEYVDEPLFPYGAPFSKFCKDSSEMAPGDGAVCIQSGRW